MCSKENVSVFADCHLTVSWPTVGRQLADSWPTVGRQLADSWLTVSQQLANSRMTDGQQSADYWHATTCTVLREEITSTIVGFHAGPLSWLNWNLEMLVFVEGRKPESPEKDP